jgi:putative toxin-antitoxin system antitoxin component (TIGR02293 family)
MNSTTIKNNSKIITRKRRENLKVIHKSPAVQKITAYKKFYKTDTTLIASARAGISSHAVTDMIEISEKTIEEIASLLYVTPRTIRNYQNDNKNLPVLQSEQLLKLYALYDKGIEALGSADAFNRWLHKPAFGLSNEIPNNLLLTSTGIKLVMDELGRIQYGDFA